ncbi:unnamed protein product [Paramecium octaurelia]|uniref:Uncharacterized protein n=1 Tax=Paramecium octaurelia TaxID=43137 RepID=A0A8S1X6F9_PAROT|nr:unnamed protein product [Paramecium octaurelia]
MRIKWIYLVFIIIQVFGNSEEQCKSKQMESALITIASGENFEFHLFDYGFADDLVYQTISDSNQQVAFPWTHLIRKTRYSIIQDEVIDVIVKNKAQYNSNYYCFLRSTQNKQIVYSLVNCQLVTDEEIIYYDVEFIIKQEQCYQINYEDDYYLVTCKDNVTNQLEFTIFHLETKLLKNILIPNIIIPPESSVKVKFHYFYFGVLINKGRMENDKYISEISQLIVFFLTSKKENLNEIIQIFKQCDVQSQPDDFITDFALYKELVFITSFKRGLTFRNLRIAWSSEITVVSGEKKQIFGVHIPRTYKDIPSSEYSIFLVIWGEDFLKFIHIQISQIYGIQKSKFSRQQLIKVYQLKSEKLFKRKVVSTNSYLVLSNDEEFQVYFIGVGKRDGVSLIYQSYANSRFYVISPDSNQLVYAEENVSYTLELQLPKIEIIGLTEIQNPQLLQLKVEPFDNHLNIKCLDTKIYYQVQQLDETKIWPKFYNQKEQNVFILKYTKKELTPYIDLSKVFSGSALNIEDVNFVNKEAIFTPSYVDATFQYDYIIIDNNMYKKVDYVGTCVFSYPKTIRKHFLFVKLGTSLYVMQCQYQSYQLCFKTLTILVQIDDIQDLICVTDGSTFQVAIVQNMQHSFIGDQVTTVNIEIKNEQLQITYTVYDTYQESKGSILSILQYPYLQVFTKLSGDVYTLNLRGQDEMGNIKIKSLELNCLNLFELANDQENYAGLFFLPMIKERNFIYHATIELYNIQRFVDRLKYVGSIICGVTKLPMKERLQVQLTKEGIFILSTCDISEDKQSKKLLFIEKSILFRQLMKKKTDQMSINKFKTQIYPTYQLQKIQKIKATRNFLYVYGSEIDAPACIYIYRIYANQMDILYHVIRPNISSLKIFNAISIWEYDLILISFNEFKRILINPNKFLNFTRSNGTAKSKLDDDELIDIKLRTLIPKDNNKINEFQIKLTCTDCQRKNNQG